MGPAMLLSHEAELAYRRETMLGDVRTRTALRDLREARRRRGRRPVRGALLRLVPHANS